MFSDITTQSKVKQLFSYNKKTGILRWKIKPAKQINIGDRAGGISLDGYVTIGYKGKRYYAQNIIWLGMYGYIPEGDIDHKDRVKYHNWLSNLREVSRQCNSRNSCLRSDNKTGVKGVYWNKSNKNWRVRIAINGKTKEIGCFIDFDEAVCHRLAAEQCLDWHGCDTDSSALKYVNENIQGGLF